MPEIPPNKHGVLQIMMLGLAAANSQNEVLHQCAVLLAVNQKHIKYESHFDPVDS